MNDQLIRQAAYALGYSEPISIEPDGSIWLGNEADRKDLTSADLKKIDNKIVEMVEAKAKAKADVIAKLGLTADEVAALLS
jgi:hypothetical protein